jgi:hypothetical protein
MKKHWKGSDCREYPACRFSFQRQTEKHVPRFRSIIRKRMLELHSE